MLSLISARAGSRPPHGQGWADAQSETRANIPGAGKHVNTDISGIVAGARLHEIACVPARPPRPSRAGCLARRSTPRPYGAFSGSSAATATRGCARSPMSPPRSDCPPTSTRGGGRHPDGDGGDPRARHTARATRAGHGDRAHERGLACARVAPRARTGRPPLTQRATGDPVGRPPSGSAPPPASRPHHRPGRRGSC